MKISYEFEILSDTDEFLESLEQLCKEFSVKLKEK